jgi:ElaB/YqjD/DUF883 family membrane-anchored ribosome-binding protein
MQHTTEEMALYAERSDVRKKISWSSIWAGALVGILVLILLNLLGIGIGFGSLDIREENNPAQGLGIGAGIWYFLSSLIALYAAGWVAGRLAQTRRLFDGALHGVLTWCVITLASLYFLTTTIGSIIGGAGQLIGSTLKTVGRAGSQAIQAAAPAISDQLPDVDLSELKNNGTTQEVITMFKNANGDPAKVDRNQLASIIMSQSGKSRPEAERTADSLVSKYQTLTTKVQSQAQDLKTKAAKAADDVASAASKTFIIAFFAFLIGAIAAAFGARLGTASKSNPYFERTGAHAH